MIMNSLINAGVLTAPVLKTTTKFPNMIIKDSFPIKNKYGDKLRVLNSSIGTPKLSAKTLERIKIHYGFKVKRDKFISKGIFKGSPLFYLSMVERLTCPTSCNAWSSCYGNNTPFMHRIDPFNEDKEINGAFKDALQSDLRSLEIKYGSFVVRLHELGDFFSVEYVELWESFLFYFEGLKIFGYTHQEDPEILNAIDRINKSYHGRFNIMQSDNPTITNRPYAMIDTLENRLEYPTAFNKDNAVICPEQEGKTASCNTCGLCMSGQTNVLFIEH